MIDEAIYHQGMPVPLTNRLQYLTPEAAARERPIMRRCP